MSRIENRHSTLLLLKSTQLFATPWLRHARLPCPSPSPGVCSNSCPSSQWSRPTVSSSVIRFASCLQSCPASGSFLIHWLFIWWPKYWCFSFSISPFNKYWGLISFRIDWLESPRDSQESSPTPQFKSINSSAFSLLYGPALTFIHDYWKNQSFD